VDLLDWYRDKLSSRRLKVLIEHLPRDSSFAKSLHGEEAEWHLSDHLLAAVVDHLAVSNWMFATVNRDEDGGEIPYPQAIPRPGPEAVNEEAPKAEPESTDASEILAFLRSTG
jgi:hypothetical protein